MDRRRFASGLAFGVGMAPLAIRAQTAGRTARVGFLTGAPQPTGAEQPGPWTLEMRRLGWIEGQNLVVERRSADGRYERMPALAQELVEAKLDVIVTPLADWDAAYVRRLNPTLPVVLIYTGMEQPSRFDLVLNLRTAKALGLAMPQPLLQRADELIE